MWSLMLTKLCEGMRITIAIFLLTLLCSLPLGLIVAFGRMSKNKVVKYIIKIYISIMRGTPLMLQLMVTYYGPYYIFGLRTPNRFTAVIFAFVINYAAYFAEIFRGGIESISIGQYEAAQLLGYSKAQTFLRIILPQTIKRVIPSITNEVITLVKDTSLAQVLSVFEMFSEAKAISSAQASIIPYIVAGVFYYIFNYLVAAVMEWTENKLSYYS